MAVPEWFANTHHLVAGAVLAFVVVLVARRWIPQTWVVLLLGVTLTATAELLMELIGYPLLFSGPPKTYFYYDTIADLGMTFAGGIIGTVAAALIIYLKP